MAKHGLGEAMKSVRYAGGISNWMEVGKAALRGDEVTRITLRNGLDIESAPGALLVPLYKEIIYKDDYRLRSDPLPRGAVVVDVGANLGMFSLHVAADHGAARVYAFEPFPESYALLKRNAEHNHLDAIVPIPLAIAGESGTRELHMQGRHGVHSLFGTSGEAVRIECITLADAFARWDIQRCDFLKLDCEGAEYEILLQRAVRRLRPHPPRRARVPRLDHRPSPRRARAALHRGGLRGHDARSRAVADGVCVREENGVSR